MHKTQLRVPHIASLYGERFGCVCCALGCDLWRVLVHSSYFSPGTNLQKDGGLKKHPYSGETDQITRSR